MRQWTDIMQSLKCKAAFIYKEKSLYHTSYRDTIRNKGKRYAAGQQIRRFLWQY